MTALYDQIGSSYRTSRRADPGIVSQLSALLQLNATTACLDLACGTGHYTRALAALGGRWHGVDVSGVMLQQAREASDSVGWYQADASTLPFPDGCFDAAMCTLAVHHFPDLLGPFREVRRVLRSGRFVLFTGLADQMRGYWLCHYFPDMMQRSIDGMPTWAAIQAALTQAGFKHLALVPYFVTAELQDLFLYAGKQRPGLYLQAEVRANISSFARLCTPDELDRGLKALAADVASGHFQAVSAACSSSGGDYAFVVAQT